VLQFILAGLALGSIYAIAASSLVITYVSAGILNFAFGAMAYTVGRLYYTLNTEHGWPILPAALTCLFVAAPALGVLLWAVLFRLLRGSSTAVKIVSTIGLSVALPPLAELVIGDQPVPAAPGLAPLPVATFDVAGAPVTLDQVITYLCVAAVLLLGVLVLRYSDVGLKVRAMVDSPALTAASGVQPARISAGVWAVSSSLAGLTGILIAPTDGLTVFGMTAFMATAFAAVVAARLTSLPITVGVSFLMGLVTAVVQRYVSPDSTVGAALIPSVPFLFIVAVLLYQVVRSGHAGETATIGGALDRAIEPAGAGYGAPERSGTRSSGRLGLVLGVAVLVALPLLFSGYWLGLLALGFAYGLLFLSTTIVTGDGGMIWLCQITFAGGAAVLAAQFASNAGWPPLVAVLVSALLMIPLGVGIGLLTIRLGELYIVLVTLCFGLLVERLVFFHPDISQYGAGVPLPRPELLDNDRVFAFVALGVFLLLALVVTNLRRSTTGMALAAVRWSEPAARTLGLSAVGTKVVISGLASFIAGLGGGFIALDAAAAQPETFATFGGLVLLAVLVTFGARPIGGAVIAGIFFAVVPGLLATLLPTSLAQLPAILFGVGAIMLARNPNGVVALHGGQISAVLDRLTDRRHVRPAADHPAATPPRPEHEPAALAGTDRGERP
jgi:branched-chain amino acid transport system permease protein